MSTFVPRDYWENRLEKTYALDGVGYIGLGKHYNNWLYKIRKTVFARRIKSLYLDFSSINVLDVGCGTGFYIDRWKDFGVRSIVGVDITQVAIENLQKNYPDIEFYRMDISDNIQSLPKDNFDVISAFDVLFHIVDDKKYANAVRNIFSLLKPGGIFVWSDNFLHVETAKSAHQVSRSLASIEQILLSVGFEIVERRPMFYLMNSPVDSRSIFRKFIWNALAYCIAKSEFAGLVIGGIIYPFELIMTSLANESPTTEIMICRKS